MISNHNLGALMGAPVHGDKDDKIGTVGQIFVDPETGTPNWATVHTGLFGRHETFVPLSDATWDHEVLHLTFDKQTIKDAPRIDTDEALSPEHEADLYRYYRIETGDRGGNHASDSDTGDSDTGDSDTDESGGSHRAAGAPESGRVRLRKYVVTEDEKMTVPVAHEEVAVESDVPVSTDGGPDADGNVRVDSTSHSPRHARNDESGDGQQLR